ncbi:MAG: TRAP transporter large permease [Sagittula sp.]|uniref:TRAP transporter large permease n=1 Tax=Sagittula sp. TaxID=2038081 RepID=UPI0040589E26
MSNIAIGLLSVPCLLLLIACRVPIALALGALSLIGLIFIRGTSAALGIFGDLPMEFGASWSLSAVPMFIFMGAIAFHTGLTKSLFEAARLWLSWLPGGLAIATNFASAGFAAASGSSLATCAAMGRIAIAEMLREKYGPALAAGCVSAAGTLGALIPPSIMFVLYGWYTETSIGALLMAGIIPGLLTAAVYSVMIYIRCSINPELGPRTAVDVSWGDRLRILLNVWPIPLLVLGVVGSIYSGIATATEAAALGCTFAPIIAAAQRNLTRTTIRDSIVEALESTASIFFVAIGALLYTRFLAFAGVPSFIAQQIALLGVDQLTIILGLSVVFLLLGMFLDPLGVLLLTLPVILPIFKAAHIDPIWAGVIVVKYLVIGMITPPVGLNVYVVKGVVGDAIALPTIFKGVMWFLVAELFIMAMLIPFPALSTYLPYKMLYS